MAKYVDFTCEHLEFKKYANGRIAITMFDPIEGPLAKATVNIPEIPLAENQVLIKNYAENENILDDLIDLKVIERSFTEIPGFSQVYNCTLTPKFLTATK